MDQESALNKCPKFHELDRIEGNGKIVRVIESGANKWDNIARRLYFEGNEIEQIRSDSHHTASQACQKVFNQWLQGKEGLRTPRTWDTVIKALREADLIQLADDLRAALVSAATHTTREAKMSTSFSSTMSNDDFMAFLDNEGLMESDRKKLQENGVGGAKIFIELTEENIDDASLGISFGGKIKLKKILTQIKASGSSGGQQVTPPPSATLDTAPHLKIEDLIQVYEKVKDVRAKWYHFGLALGLNPNDLDSIDSRCRGIPDQCLTETLKAFLNRPKPKPTWNLLADAVGSQSVGHGMLAEELRKNQK